MTNENKMKNAFFDSYKSFMNYLMVISNMPNEYIILVETNDVNAEESKINISISKNTYTNNKDDSITYKNNIVLSKESVSDLINDIRTDFIKHHFITYASINERNMTQTIQNTRFSLIFKLKTYTDLLEAYEINSYINLKKEETNKGKIRELGLK